MTTQLLDTWAGKDGMVSPLSTASGEQAPQAAGSHHSSTAYIDAEMRIRAAEPDFSRRFGRTPADTCGRSLYELLHPSSPAVLTRRFNRLLEGRSNRFAQRVVGLNSSGSAFSAKLAGIALQDIEGQLTGIVLQVRPDTTPDAEIDEGCFASGERLLSRLDAQVLEGVARGASTVQLATRLYLSRQGVEYHVGIMLRKLKSPNRAALVARAHCLGMLTVGQWPPRVLPEFIK